MGWGSPVVENIYICYGSIETRMPQFPFTTTMKTLKSYLSTEDQVHSCLKWRELGTGCKNCPFCNIGTSGPKQDTFISSAFLRRRGWQGSGQGPAVPGQFDSHRTCWKQLPGLQQRPVCFPCLVRAPCIQANFVCLCV